MTTDERIDRLTGIVESLAATPVAHDNQIDGLIRVAEKHSEDIANLSKEIASIGKQWQAYINTLPRQ